MVYIKQSGAVEHFFFFLIKADRGYTRLRQTRECARDARTRKRHYELTGSTSSLFFPDHLQSIWFLQTHVVFCFILYCPPRQRLFINVVDIREGDIFGTRCPRAARRAGYGLDLMLFFLDSAGLIFDTRT